MAFIIFEISHYSEPHVLKYVLQNFYNTNNN